MSDREKSEHAKLVRERAQLKADVANLKMLVRKIWPLVEESAGKELRQLVRELGVGCR